MRWEGPAVRMRTSTPSLRAALALTLTLIALGGSATIAGGAPQATSAQVIAFVGGMLLDGYEAPPIHDSVVLVRDGRITAVGTVSSVEIPAGATIVDTGGRTVMPGLIDLHMHLDLIGHANYPDYYEFVFRTDRLTEVMETAAKQMLRAGVTGAVDLGAPLETILPVRERVDRGEIPGPRMQVSGIWLTRIAMSSSPAELQNVISSPEEAAAETTSLLDRGADVIKTWVGLTDDDMRAIVETAHARGAKVHAHLYRPEAIQRALDTGVDVLQHVGSAGNPAYDDALVAAVAHSRKPIVQTIAHRIWVYPETLQFPSRLRDPRLARDMSPEVWAEMQRSFIGFREAPYFHDAPRQIRNSKVAARQFIEAGAMIGVGTDAASPLNFHTEAMWREISALVDSGMSELRAISAATKTNAEIMGLGDETGTIELGKRADIIVVNGDPLFDINMLGQVELVMKDGIVWFSDLDGIDARRR